MSKATGGLYVRWVLQTDVCLMKPFMLLRLCVILREIRVWRMRCNFNGGREIDNRRCSTGESCTMTAGLETGVIKCEGHPRFVVQSEREIR